MNIMYFGQSHKDNVDCYFDITNPGNLIKKDEPNDIDFDPTSIAFGFMEEGDKIYFRTKKYTVIAFMNKTLKFTNDMTPFAGDNGMWILNGKETDIKVTGMASVFFIKGSMTKKEIITILSNNDFFRKKLRM